MTLCYNTLPPHTKQAANKMGEMCHSDYNQWLRYRAWTWHNKYRNNDIILWQADVAAGYERFYWKSYQVDIKIWLEVIKAFELLTTKIMLELAPFVLGSKE